MATSARDISTDDLYSGEGQIDRTEPQQDPEQVVIEQNQHDEKEEKNDNVYDDKENSVDDKGSNLEDEDYPEYISVDLGQILTHLTCQICLANAFNLLCTPLKEVPDFKRTICLKSVMRKVRAIKACSHRFCGECIEKSLRVGKKECPLCRVHCSSHRATVDDVHFDAIITHLLPYIDQEDYKLSEEDKSRNEQLQATISGIAHQQSKRRRTNRRDS